MSTYTSETPVTKQKNGLAITGLVLSFLVSPVGLVISIIAMVKSRRRNKRDGLALAGIIIGTIGTIVMASIASVILSVVPYFGELSDKCEGLPSGTSVSIQGEQIPCL